MSRPIVKINNEDVTRYLQSELVFNQYNDESKFFYGVFRRSDLKLTLNNTRGFFDTNSELWNNSGRNNATVEILYEPNNKTFGQVSCFHGVIDEGSTTDNLTEKTVTFTVVDYLKLLNDKTINTGDQAQIDSRYLSAKGGKEIKLDQSYIEAYLTHFLLDEDGQDLLFPFQVGLTVESIFPPSDSYYDADGVSALDILMELVRATNSYATFEQNTLYINPRPTRNDPTHIPTEEVLSVENETDGFNKIFNKIRINNLKTYTQQESVEAHGERQIDLSIFAAPSQPLAQSFFDYYAQPKREADLLVRMSNRTLNLLIGDDILIDIDPKPDLSIKGFEGAFYIISRSVDFQTEIVNLRIREK